MVEYKYDSWGNHAVLDANGADIALATHIGNLNPFRYRGYYFDGTKFTSEDQIQVGDEVVIYGKLSTYEGRHQLAMGNMICSLTDGNGTVGTDRIKAECQTLTDVYSLSGVRVRSQVSVSEATKGLPKGIYIVNGKKVIVR